MGEAPVGLRPQVAPPKPQKAVCVITGLPAKYRDPLTGLPYATLEAFRQLRAADSSGKGVHHLVFAVKKRGKRRSSFKGYGGELR